MRFELDSLIIINIDKELYSLTIKEPNYLITITIKVYSITNS